MNKETSSRVSSIAARLVHVNAETIRIVGTNGSNGPSDLAHPTPEKLAEDIRTLAASALGQDEHAGQDKPDFFTRLKDERDDLDRRLAALNSYLTHNPGHPSPAHAEMLKRQAVSMSELLAILDERIADIEATRKEHDL